MDAIVYGQKTMRKLLLISRRPKIVYVYRFIVMGVILQMVIIALIGCEKAEKSDIANNLPETIDHHLMGKAIGISPRSFIDTLNNGAMGEVYYFGDSLPENPDHVVKVPGMKTVFLAEMTQILDTLESRETIFMISLYGADSRKMAQSIVPFGYTVYYVVGGGYKLAELMRQQRLEILPRPQMKVRRN